jgi:acyl carrier protein
MTADISDGVMRIVRLQLGLRKVSDNQRLVEDLGAESVDVVNIIGAVESRFGVSFKEKDISSIRTVGDICRFTGLYRSG